MSNAPATSSKPRFPVLEGVLPIDPSRVPIDVVAGVTLAALAIPEVMGYTAIAGTPVVTGLYTILLPIAVFAILGSSRHLVVGADSATAAILAAGLVVLAAPESPSYVALAALAALITAGWLILARVIGLAFLADFLSRSVLVGFLTGVGIQVAAGQIAGILGVPGGGTGTIDKAFTVLSQIPQANVPTFIVSASVLVVIVGLRMVAKQIPGALLAVVGSIIELCLQPGRARDSTAGSGARRTAVDWTARCELGVDPTAARDHVRNVRGHSGAKCRYLTRLRGPLRGAV